jgi:DNA invertase Pin-like site-specific DNA recombinase
MSSENIFLYVRRLSTQTVSDADFANEVRQTIGAPPDARIETFVDDAGLTGRGKRRLWHNLIDRLREADRVIVASAADLPCRTIGDLLKVLSVFRDHGVRLCLHAERIDTAAAVGFAILDVIDAFRRAKRSAAVKAGQARAVAAGKTVGRPAIPKRLAADIRAAVIDGNGVRATARRYGVSPASVVNLRQFATTDLADFASPNGA